MAVKLAQHLTSRLWHSLLKPPKVYSLLITRGIGGKMKVDAKTNLKMSNGVEMPIHGLGTWLVSSTLTAQKGGRGGEANGAE